MVLGLLFFANAQFFPALPGRLPYPQETYAPDVGIKTVLLGSGTKLLLGGDLGYNVAIWTEPNEPIFYTLFAG